MKTYELINNVAGYRTAVNSGIETYQKEKIRIEFITLSISDQDHTDIMEYFEKLIPHLLYKKQFGHVDFCGVVVSKQHLHFFIRKPFVLLETLRSSWNRITGRESNVRIRTIKYNMDGIYLYTDLLRYTIEQSDHHIGTTLQYVKSPYWGIVIHKKREKKEETKTNWRKKQFKSDETMYIFETKEILTKDEITKRSVENPQIYQKYL